MDIHSTIQRALALHKRRDFKGAKEIYDAALEVAPHNPDLNHLLGCLLDDLGRTEEAVSYVKTAIQRQPGAYNYAYNLGNMLAKLDRFEEAGAAYKQALRLKPDYAAAHNNLGRIYFQLGDYTSAEKCFKTAIVGKSNFPEPFNNLGLLFNKLGRADEAYAAFCQAIKLQPNYADALSNIGSIHLAQQDVSRAAEAYARAVKAQPNNSKLLVNLGVAYLKLLRQHDSIDLFRKALDLDGTCVAAANGLITTTSYVSEDSAALKSITAEWNQRFGATRQPDDSKYQNALKSKDRIRIGYVSGDFRNHAAAYWIEPALAASDRTKFEVFCYNNSTSTDKTTLRLQEFADHWIDCTSLSDDALHDRIVSDGIHILVDLSNHTDGNRLLALNRQPAPVQLTWFGFPIPTGLGAIQYRLSDSIIESPETPAYGEKVLSLDRFYAAYKPEPSIPPVGISPFERNGHVTFASFNNLAKVTFNTLDVWARVLAMSKDSRLYIQSAGLEDRDLQRQIFTHFQSRGIGKERISLSPWRDAREYFQLGNEVDISLDTFPFNGGVTTCHALWMGIPVVTRCANVHASRVGRSILTQAGLSEYVANNWDDYVRIAVDLAVNPVKLSELRQSLRSKLAQSGLLDGPNLMRQVETHYQHIWKDWLGTHGYAN